MNQDFTEKKLQKIKALLTGKHFMQHSADMASLTADFGPCKLNRKTA